MALFGKRREPVGPFDPPPLTPKGEKRLRERLDRWAPRAVWTLAEAPLVTFGIKPDPLIEFFSIGREWLGTIPLQDLLRRAIRGGIVPANRDAADPEDWWMFPTDYACWLADQAHLVGKERLEIFREYFPEMGGIKSARVRALQSGYTTEELEICFEVIDEFWRPAATRKDWRRPKEEEIKDWIKTRYPDLSKNTVDHIYGISRTPQNSEPKFLGQRGEPRKST